MNHIRSFLPIRGGGRSFGGGPTGVALVFILWAWMGSSGYAYEVARTSGGAEIKWFRPRMTYFVNAAGAPAGFVTAAKNAGSTWNGTGSRFRFIYGGATASHAYAINDGQNTIDFGALSGASIVGQAYKWFNSTSGQILDVDIRLNASKPWSAGGFDVQSIFTHEMGHALSLSDLYNTYDQAKTMYYLSSRNDTRLRTLESDDIDGIRHLYPVPNGDDPAVFDRGTARWFVLSLSLNSPIAYNKLWGYSGVLPVSGDFSGDGYTDLGVYDPATGKWYIYNLRNGTTITFGMKWGFSGTVPVPADYDGDGYTDLGVFDSNSGKWYIYNLKNGTTITFGKEWGFGGSMPVPADYNNDGRADLAVYYPPTGAWFIYDLFTGKTLNFNFICGFAGTTPVVGDFDGDGFPDLGVYHSASGKWNIFSRHTGKYIVVGLQWGFSGVTPLAGDYNGDSRDEIVVFNSNTGTWYAYDLNKKYGFLVSVLWGYHGVVPVRGNFGP